MSGTTCMCGVCGGQKRGSCPLERQLLKVVSYQELGIGIKTRSPEREASALQPSLQPQLEFILSVLDYLCMHSEKA